MNQLDVATGAFLENDDALWINENRTEVRLTQLFQWYQVTTQILEISKSTHLSVG